MSDNHASIKMIAR